MAIPRVPDDLGKRQLKHAEDAEARREQRRADPFKGLASPER